MATHGKASDKDPLQSYLVLARTEGEDGYLRVPDILELKLYADLVILSACETGRGHITGDGVNGLSRAFLLAGTSSLLMSLWSIPEKETLYQLYIFHESWRKEGLSKAQALRQAQREELANYPEEPDAWAGFAIIGEWL